MFHVEIRGDLEALQYKLCYLLYQSPSGYSPHRIVFDLRVSKYLTENISN